MAEPAIVVQDLRKSYAGVEALTGISFEVAEGEVFGSSGRPALAQLPRPPLRILTSW